MSSEVGNSRWRPSNRVKPEVLISRHSITNVSVLWSQFPDKIATKFQRLPDVFGDQEVNGIILDTTSCNRKWVFQYGVGYWRPLYRKYLHDSNEIINATIKFREPATMSKILLRVLHDVTDVGNPRWWPINQKHLYIGYISRYCCEISTLRYIWQ